MKRLLLVISLGVMIGMGMLATSQTPTTTPAPLPKAMQAVGVLEPRVSPDGKTIAVSYQGSIWTLPIGGGAMTCLTHGDGYDMEPAWSPDGKHLAFIRGPFQPGGLLQVIRADDGAEIALPKPITVRGPYNIQKLTYHPDGKRLLAVFRVEGIDHGLGWLDLATGKVASLNINLGQFSRYALDPTGKWVVWTTTLDRQGEQMGNDSPHTDIWRMPAMGGAPAKVARFPARIYDLCIDAAGQGMIVVSDLGGVHNDLWHVPLTDSLARMKKLTHGQADEDRPSLSAEGKKLVYTDNRHGPTALMTRDLDSGKEQTVVIERLDFRRPTGTLKLTLRDADTKKPVVARVSLRADKGKFVAPPGTLVRFIRDLSHFYCDREAEWTLPAGKYTLRAQRGPEYKQTLEEIDIAPGRTTERTMDLARWTHAAKRGWHSGENHIHANYGYGQWYNTPRTMLEQCAGEDLGVCNLVVANSDGDGVFDRAFFRGGPDPLSTPETILYWNQEFRSTFWGHMTLVNLRQVVEPVFTGFKDTTNPWDIPTNSDIADRAHWQKGLVNYTHAIQNPERPFDYAYAAKGLAVDAALGKIDTIDLNRSYAGTVPVWYRLLNCGFRLAPSAGTDCFLNRMHSQLPGGDRAYVRIDGALDYGAWIEGLRAGKSFISNGPMLELTAGDCALGETLKLPRAGKVRVKASARSHVPMTKVVLVERGQVVRELALSADGRSAEMDEELPIEKSGWLALRATGPGQFDLVVPSLYAHTAPIYLEIAGSAPRSRADAQYFLNWLDELTILVRQRDRIPTEGLRRHVHKQIEDARAIWTRIAKEAGDTK